MLSIIIIKIIQQNKWDGNVCAEDITETIMFLLSDLLKAISGQNKLVDACFFITKVAIGIYKRDTIKVYENITKSK